ncbi:MAG: hypothetical protein Fur0032_07760 [Terrimicrobiaceae bacterium]
MKTTGKTKTYRRAGDIRVGVIGYGGAFNMGRNHLLEMQSAGMTPTAVCEIDPDRLKVATTDFPGIETYSDVGTLLKKSAVDLVVIITPHNSHAALSIQCLKAGRHVVCEKPLAITTAEVDAMIRAAQSSGAMLSAYHNRHWDGWILQAVELIRKKRVIGDVVRISCRMGGYSRPGDWWRSSRSISGGILYDWGVHLLEYSLQLVDSPILEVSGFVHEGFWAPKTKWKEDTNEDDGFVVVRFGNGELLTLSISHLESNQKSGWVEVTGTKGSLVFGGQPTTLHEFRNGNEHLTRFSNRQSECHRYYENIAAHLTSKAPLVITAEWARRPIHILDLAAQSARKGSALRAKYH